jgi:hypothetical protein
MADAARLMELGLGVTDGGAGPEAVLQLGAPLLNPLAGRSIPSGVFALAEDRLIPLEPPELVGLPALSLEGVRSRSELEQQLARAFQTHLVTLQRRSAELRTLGLTAQVDPETLEIVARVDDPPFRFVLTGDKRGQLHIAEAARDGADPMTDVGDPFDLTEFPNRAGLLAHLRALVSPAKEAPVAAAQPTAPRPLDYRDLLEHFGRTASVPAVAAIDVVVAVRARGTSYRFAAMRVSGRTFRALLAGPEGKIWSDQFELDAFQGVSDIVAGALGIAPGEVELLDSLEER